MTNQTQRILAELSDDTYLREDLANKQQELVQLKAEIQPLESQKYDPSRTTYHNESLFIFIRESLERRAARRASLILWTGFGYCVIQAAIVARYVAINANTSAIPQFSINPTHAIQTIH